MKIQTLITTIALATFAPAVAFAQTTDESPVVPGSGTGTQAGSGANRGEATSVETAPEGNGAGASSGTGTQAGSGTDRGAIETTGTPTPTPMP